MNIVTDQQQQGAALVISLVMLLLLTLLGTTAIRSSIFEERMSHNLRDSQYAFEASETALTDAEAWVSSLASEPVPSSSCGSAACVRQYDATFYPEDQTAAWWTSNSAAATTALGNVATAPRYIVEFMRFVPDSTTLSPVAQTGKYYYRVTARATGSTNDAVTILQTTVVRRF